ncbi:hypothetical protein FVE85_5617 [Porphyridium purpureum]|uniref:Uncharacterized protein n=1 Tax=Porphyridium purpureum TaxID=35688 RepID=A0A5J4Z4F0_PORPP|nr:hypothetical protein FVE85_5617 [Porphyridium purpureum]|eukprot:POR4702..scf295_1
MTTAGLALPITALESRSGDVIYMDRYGTSRFRSRIPQNSKSSFSTLLECLDAAVSDYFALLRSREHAVEDENHVHDALHMSLAWIERITASFRTRYAVLACVGKVLVKLLRTSPADHQIYIREFMCESRFENEWLEAVSDALLRSATCTCTYCCESHLLSYLLRQGSDFAQSQGHVTLSTCWLCNFDHTRALVGRLLPLPELARHASLVLLSEPPSSLVPSSFDRVDGAHALLELYTSLYFVARNAALKRVQCERMPFITFANVTHVLGAAQMRPDARFWDTWHMAAVAEHGQMIAGMDAQALANIIWSLGAQRVTPDRTVLSALMERYTAFGADHSSAQETANFIWGASQMNREAVLAASLSNGARTWQKWLRSFVSSSRKMNAHELSISLWSLAELGIDKAICGGSVVGEDFEWWVVYGKGELARVWQLAFRERMAERSRTSSTLSLRDRHESQTHDCTPQSLANVLWALDRLGIALHTDFLQAFTSAFSRCSEAANPFELRSILRSMVALQVIPSAAFLSAWRRGWEASMRSVREVEEVIAPTRSDLLSYAVSLTQLKQLDFGLEMMQAFDTACCVEPYRDGYTSAREEMMTASDYRFVVWACRNLGYVLTAKARQRLMADFEVCLEALPSIGNSMERSRAEMDAFAFLWGAVHFEWDVPRKVALMWSECMLPNMTAMSAGVFVNSVRLLARLEARASSEWFAAWSARFVNNSQSQPLCARAVVQCWCALGRLGMRPDAATVRAFELCFLAHLDEYDYKSLFEIIKVFRLFGITPDAQWVPRLAQELL